MHSDEQYGRQLGLRLRLETRDLHADPELIGKLRRRQARRGWAVRAAFGTALAAASAAAILVVTTGPDAPGGQPPDNAVLPTDRESMVNVAHVQAETIRAVSRASDYVIYEKQTYQSGYFETWTDKSTHRDRTDVYSAQVTRTATRGPDGTIRAPSRSAADRGPVRLHQSHAAQGPRDGERTVTWVDYEHRTWGTGREEAGPPSELPDVTDADSLRRAVSDGDVDLVGPETVDGVDTVHLRIATTFRGYRIDIWVDAQSYLPVRQTHTVQTDAPTAEPKVVITYSWLPRTEENLARLTLTPPSGFTRRD
jgi:hypothetical protein